MKGRKVWYKPVTYTHYGKDIPHPYDVASIDGHLSVVRTVQALVEAGGRNQWTIGFLESVMNNGIENALIRFRREMESMICKVVLPNGRWLIGRMVGFNRNGFTVIKPNGRRSEMRIDYSDIVNGSIGFDNVENEEGQHGNQKRMRFQVK